MLTAMRITIFIYLFIYTKIVKTVVKQQQQQLHTVHISPVIRSPKRTEIFNCIFINERENCKLHTHRHASTQATCRKHRQHGHTITE